VRLRIESTMTETGMMSEIADRVHNDGGRG